MPDNDQAARVPDLEETCRRVLAANPAQVSEFRAGKSLLGFFVGRVMTETRGTADPRRATEVLQQMLAESPV